MEMERAQICRLLDYYGGALSERRRALLDLYYNDDLSLSEIGENCGITRQAVRDALKRGVAELCALERAVGYAAQSERILALARQIRAESAEPHIRRLADEIIGDNV